MRFDYKTLPSGARRPIIPIVIECGDVFVRQEALVDSGSDVCLFDIGVAVVLGIDQRDAIIGTIEGVAGVPAVVFYHRVRIRVGTCVHTTVVGFTKLPEESEGIVGQRGFFDSYVVTMDYDRKIVRLT